MSPLTEVVARYHKLLESEAYHDLAWAEQLQARMRNEGLVVAGRLVSPVLRPNFLARKQYTGLIKAAEPLMTAVERVEKLALANPVLLSRIQLLPAEKMLAAVDPGYNRPAVTAWLDASVHNGSPQFTGYNAESPTGLAYGEVLARLFLETGPMQEMSKRYPLESPGGTGQLLSAIPEAYREFGGRKKPQIAILTFRQPFPTIATAELALFADRFRREGYVAEMVSPEQLEYSNGILRKGNFEINVVFRHLKMNEFLLRCDLNHPLVRAYRDHAVCVVNSFRSELARKPALFHLLTDEAVTGRFPVAERKAIREHIPWTRIVANTKTQHWEQTVDLPEFIRQNREQLVLKPNEEESEQQTFVGARTDAARWDRALRNALRGSYVVQSAVAPCGEPFPIYRDGSLETRELQVHVQPHSFLGQVSSCSSWLSSVASNGFSTSYGLAPTFVVGR